MQSKSDRCFIEGDADDALFLLGNILAGRHRASAAVRALARRSPRRKPVPGFCQRGRKFRWCQPRRRTAASETGQAKLKRADAGLMHGDMLNELPWMRSLLVNVEPDSDITASPTQLPRSQLRIRHRADAVRVRRAARGGGPAAADRHVCRDVRHLRQCRGTWQSFRESRIPSARRARAGRCCASSATWSMQTASSTSRAKTFSTKFAEQLGGGAPRNVAGKVHAIGKPNGADAPADDDRCADVFGRFALCGAQLRCS